MHIWILRAFGYIACLFEVYILIKCIIFLCRTPEYRTSFLLCIVPILLFYHVLPIFFSRYPKGKIHIVHPTGNSWTIGKYSESQIRESVEQCTRGLPKKLQKPRIIITDHRSTMGWTWLSILWPGRERKKTVFITAGALHYLEADELCTLILHEIGHHDSKNRADIPGGWTLLDLALFSLVFLMSAEMEFGIKVVLNIFLPLRALLAWIVYWLQGQSGQMVEHFCDLYSAQHIGKNAMINTLLKTGEEAELSEVVLARAARQLLYVKSIEAEDLYDVFEKVRPYGRIFHDNLFKHSSETVTKIQGDLNPKHLKAKKPNEMLNEFLIQRPTKQKKRIRWRRFDKNKDGRLDKAEIKELCTVLKKNPERPLFLSEHERNPTTHPSYRDRILMLFEIQDCAK